MSAVSAHLRADEHSAHCPRSALSLARSRHDVTLTSDGMTTVKLLRAGDNGALGSLERTTLQLIPGRYTVTGRRAGFIDVRTDFEVPPDGGPF